MTLRRSLLPALALFALAAGPHPAAASSYLALGDSYAYGFTTLGDLISSGEGYLLSGSPADQAKLYGDQGYVKDYADYLTLKNGATTGVTNLAVPGETLSSFLTGGNGQEAANLNYGGLFTPSGQSQSALLAQKLGGGARYGDITVQLGGNDLLGLAGSSAFQAAGSAAQPGQLTAAQQAIATGALGAFDTSYTSLLAGLKQAEPGANVFVIGYFDPFTPLDTNQYPTRDPYNGLGRLLLPELNAHLRADAQAAGVQYVDIAPAFAGQETTLSNDTQPFETPADAAALQLLSPGLIPTSPPTFPDYHPNDAGYGVIARQIEATVAVPEPGAWALLALGLPLALVPGRRQET